MTRCRPPHRFVAQTCSSDWRHETFDVLVIGGGITGAGVALDAATRGLRTALVERDDFASGTSSKSSKLVHGGLRYLQQGEVRLVYEALHERAAAAASNAPHLVKVLPFMIPILTKDWRGVAQDRPGARLGDVDVRPHRRLAHRQVPPAAEEGRGVRPPADDAERAPGLGVPVLRRHRRRRPAVPHRGHARPPAHGAVVVNRCRVVELTKDATDSAIGRRGRRRRRATITVRAKVVVNAAGVWADDVRALDEGAHPDSIRPAKGVHITVPWDKVRNDIAVVIPVPKDKRSLFVVPWGAAPDGTFEHTYVGTTDTDYDGPIDDPQCTEGRHRLRAAGRSTHRSPPASPRPTSPGSWAGLRPLVKSAIRRVAPPTCRGATRSIAAPAT